jgi:hypothetical protein
VSGTDWTSSAGEQVLSPKRGRSHTHGIDTPTATRVDRSSAAAEEQTPYMRLRSNGSGTPKYHFEHGSHGDGVKALPASRIIASDLEDAIVNESKQRVALTDSRRSSANNKHADDVGVRAPIVQTSSRHPQSTTDSPQAQHPLADLQQPVPLDLQREYNLVREHISRKDIASGLPAIASIAALRSCMVDLRDAAKMKSEAWFLMEREKIDEELIQGGFAGLPMV